MTPRWCLLYRIKHDGGVVIECSGRSWAATAEKAAEDLSRTVKDVVKDVEIVAVLPWASEHHARTTAELFAGLGKP